MQIQDSKPNWSLLLGLLLVLGGLAAAPFFLFKPKGSPVFTIQNFAGSAEFYSATENAWIPLRRGAPLGPGDKIRTGKGAEIDLQVPDQFRLRLKENSQADVPQPRFYDRGLKYRLYLLKGTLLGATDKEYEESGLEVSTPTLVAAVRGTMFLVQSEPETKESSVRVLKGTMVVRSRKTGKSVKVHALEKTQVKEKEPPLKPIRVSRQEWNQMREAYELIQTSSALEAKQVDLSKEAGSLFQYVFDQGTFYTPNLGHAEREFIKDPSSGKVHLKAEYDVFPVGSFVGLYMKTRNLDAHKFKAIRFQVRGDTHQGFPESFRIELKWKWGVMVAFNPRNVKTGWQTIELPLRFKRPTSISEVTLVFANDKVGANKTGILYLKEIELIPAEPTS